MIEEKECQEINRRLKEYEKSLKSIFKEKNYSEIITDGTIIIDLMLEVISRRNNWPLNDIKTNLPIKAKNPLIEIDRLNEKIDKENVTYKKTRKFLKSFKRFAEWFNNNDDFACDVDNCINLIESLPNTEPAANTGSEESEYVGEINESLENLEKHLELISKENYAGAVRAGYNVCSLMLELFLKNEKYSTDNGSVIYDDEKIPIIVFCTQKDIFPKECNGFLNVMDKYENKFFESNGNYDLALTFLMGLSYFLIWFNNYYSKKYSIDNPFEIENCYSSINKLAQQQNEAIFKTKTSKTKKQKTEIESGMNGLQINTLNSNDSLLLSKMEEMSEMIKSIKKDTETIITTLKDLTQQITDYQSLIDRLDKKVKLPDEIKDDLIAAFADECAERIVKQTNLLKDDDSYNLEKTNLEKSLGDDAWAKLSDESKTYLISSKLMFNNLNEMDEDLDYSGVCILVTKTLEVEMFKRFYENFLSYLKRNRYKKYENYPTGLLYENRDLLRPEKFNLGTLAYIFCLSRNCGYNRMQKNKMTLVKYCKSDLFKECETDDEIESLIKKYGDEIENIRKNYRNPSAHRNNIDKDKAKECLNLVLCDEDNLLKEMLGSFKQ